MYFCMRDFGDFKDLPQRKACDKVYEKQKVYSSFKDNI